MLTLILIGQLTITAYRSVPAQTDSTPFYTATGEHVYRGGCAASRDLICPMCFLKSPLMRMHTRDHCPCKNRLHYGDLVYVKGYGILRVNDTMHPRLKRHIDIWVRNYAGEHKIGTRHQYTYRFEEQN